MVVIKRNGSVENFDRQKICTAISKAMKYCIGDLDVDCITTIAKQIEELFDLGKIQTVREIEDKVFYMLIEHGYDNVAKEYEGYRAIQAFKKQSNTTDDSILGLIKNTNDGQKSNDPFWDNSSLLLFNAVFFYLKEKCLHRKPISKDLTKLFSKPFLSS